MLPRGLESPAGAITTNRVIVSKNMLRKMRTKEGCLFREL
jgi:hypothetical protein